MSEVDLMHVLHRPHLPRLISITIVAAVLAIAISLALASALSNINQPRDPARHTAPAPAGPRHATAPREMSNPFVNPLNRPLSSLPWPPTGPWSPPWA
jgi:hypothetical protein